MRIQFKKICLMILLAVNFSCANADGLDNEINFMTFNIACLPVVLGVQVNADILRPNDERAQEIIRQVNSLTRAAGVDAPVVPNVIAFEEAFDMKVRGMLEQQLAARYPYNSGTLGERKLNAGSGLLLFSQYPILAMEFHPYTNAMIGDEKLANKGFITAKLKYNNKYFFTVIITHLTSGDAVLEKQQDDAGTTSYRRGEQMGRMYVEIQTKASTPPAGYENLQYLKTFVLGDFNAPLNNEREQKSISTGFSANNGFKAGQVKYPGQYWLFSVLQNTVPSNFADVRILPMQQGASKKVDPNLLAQAMQDHRFIGSTIPVEVLKANLEHRIAISRQNAEYNVIDGLFASKDGVAGDLQTKLVSFNEITNYQYQLSDHYVLMGQFSFVDGKN